MSTEDHTTDEKDFARQLDPLLAGLSDVQLRRIIRSLVEEEPELLDAVRQETGWLCAQAASTSSQAVATQESHISVDIPAIRREIRKNFRDIVRDDYHQNDWSDDLPFNAEAILRPHLDTVRRLLSAGDAAAATLVLTAVVEQWGKGLAELGEWEYDQSDETIDEASSDVDSLLAEALLSQNLSIAERKRWLARVHDWEEDVIFLGSTEAALEQWWDYPPLVAVLQGNIGKQGAWEGEAPEWADSLALARLHILERQGRTQEYLNLALAEGQTLLYLQMLVHLGQVERAVDAALQMLGSPSDALSLAKLLHEQGQQPAAQAVASHGLAISGGYGHSELAHWTVDLAQEIGDPQLALRAALVAFAYTHQLNDYMLAERLAGRQWPALRNDLLETVSRFYDHDQLSIYLYERMLPQAMAVVDRGNLYWELDRVLPLTGADYPDWSIAHAKRQAERIMDAGESKSYDKAVQWLHHVRDIYLQHHRGQEWAEYVSAIRSQHARKYKLIGLLREFA